MHEKLSLPAPEGQPQEIDPPQLFVSVPQALPITFAGQTAGVQHAFGFADVLHVSPQLIVPPQPSLNGPHLSPPVFGPFGTFAQVYGAPRPLAHAHVPVAPAVVVEQVRPLGQPQLIVPPTPLVRLVPHLPV